VIIAVKKDWIAFKEADQNRGAKSISALIACCQQYT
jgi:hypothetical protein